MANVSPGKQLRDVTATHTIQIPGAPFALAARLIQESGYSAAYVSGAVLSAGTLAVPDVGLFTLTELTEHCRRMTEAVELPVLVDADTGFGGPLNVRRTIQQLERAGAAAIQLEDQQLPKRCGHLTGKSLVSADEMCAKLRAAVDARHDPDLVLVARTDARAERGLDEALRRAEQYLAAGADWIFPEALASEEEFEVFASEIDAPLIANMTEFGRSPLIAFDQFVEWNYAAVLYPVTLFRVAMKAMESALHLLGAEGSQHELLDIMQTRQELYDLLDYRDYEERDRSYFQGRPSRES